MRKRGEGTCSHMGEKERWRDLLAHERERGGRDPHPTRGTSSDVRENGQGVGHLIERYHEQHGRTRERARETKSGEMANGLTIRNHQRRSET